MGDTDQSGALGAVRWTEVFESIDADEFTELALLAREVSKAPIALVTLVDEDRQWFTSVTGARLTAGPWEQTFCAHAVQQHGVFVVPDALRDPRFAVNPLVRADPFVRFYAGAPLLADGTAVGTLCVMDVAPRELPAASAAGLTALARQVVMQLQLRRQTRRLVKLNDALATEARERQLSEARLRDSEHALRTSQQALQQIDVERRELVANISHDLRTPLTALQGYLDTVLMKADSLDAAGQQRYVQHALPNRGGCPA
ncbi:MAG TPA: GAF domain-containing protein [Vicinamibacterales bacterium]|nr:GAF domain-containing protein [Vicinamibacterales bacterium]